MCKYRDMFESIKLKKARPTTTVMLPRYMLTSVTE
jgi:hypothetical protein